MPRLKLSICLIYSVFKFCIFLLFPDLVPMSKVADIEAASPGLCCNKCGLNGNK